MSSWMTNIENIKIYLAVTKVFNSYFWYTGKEVF